MLTLLTPVENPVALSLLIWASSHHTVNHLTLMFYRVHVVFLWLWGIIVFSVFFFLSCLFICFLRSTFISHVPSAFVFLSYFICSLFFFFFTWNNDRCVVDLSWYFQAMITGAMLCTLRAFPDTLLTGITLLSSWLHHKSLLSIWCTQVY